jgi:hypothetical protein
LPTFLGLWALGNYTLTFYDTFFYWVRGPDVSSIALEVFSEEVVKRGVPVVVFDHMGEYLSMERAVDGGKGLDLIKLVPGSNATIDFEDIMKNSQILTTVGVTDAQLNLLEMLMLRRRAAITWG